jgi:exodeoxyribonuclease VIII
MTFQAYQAIDAVNWTTLKEMGRSPKHYRHRLETPREDTPALAMGRAAHTAVFEPDRFILDYAVFTGPRRAGKEWDAFAAANEGRTILKTEEYQRCLAIRDAVRAHPVAARYLASGMAEHTVRWTDEETGLACKGRADWVAPMLRALVDLKTTGDVNDRIFGHTAARLGYPGQLAFYYDGLRLSGMDLEKVIIIAVESGAPHDVAVFRVDEDVLYTGREQYRGYLRRVAGCRKLGAWPGRYAEEQSLELPPWARDDEEDAPDFDEAETSMGAGL